MKREPKVHMREEIDGLPDSWCLLCDPNSLKRGRHASTTNVHEVTCLNCLAVLEIHPFRRVEGGAMKAEVEFTQTVHQSATGDGYE